MRSWQVDPNAIVRSITVQIAAPAQVVWDVLVDFDRQLYEWNPFCVEASGVLESGSPLSMKLSYTEEGQYFDN